MSSSQSLLSPLTTCLSRRYFLPCSIALRTCSASPSLAGGAARLDDAGAATTSPTSITATMSCFMGRNLKANKGGRDVIVSRPPPEDNGSPVPRPLAGPNSHPYNPQAYSLFA